MINISLEPIAKDDLPQMLTWRNDYRIWAYTRQNDLIDEIHHAEWYERQSRDPTVRMYKLVARSGGSTSFIGVAGFTSLDFANRKAEFSLYIGPQFQKHGFGEKALGILFEHGFTNLGLNCIWGETFDGNPASRLFERIGMQREGTVRERYWKDGKFIDAHLYSVLRGEWLAIRNNPGASASSTNGDKPVAPAEVTAVPSGPGKVPEYSGHSAPYIVPCKTTEKTADSE